MVNKVVIGINTDGNYVVICREGDDFSINYEQWGGISGIDTIRLHDDEIILKSDSRLANRVARVILDSFEDSLMLIKEAEIADIFLDEDEAIVGVQIIRYPVTYSRYFGLRKVDLENLFSEKISPEILNLSFVREKEVKKFMVL